MKLYHTKTQFGSEKITTTPKLDGYYADKILNEFETHTPQTKLVKLKRTRSATYRTITEFVPVDHITSTDVDDLFACFVALRDASAYLSDTYTGSYRTGSITSYEYYLENGEEYAT